MSFRLFSRRAIPSATACTDPKKGEGFELCWSETSIMGVVNVTPDSFSDGNKYLAVDTAVSHAKQLIEDGAFVLDIGGESTRPGATPVPAAEEIDRVLPVIKRLAEETDAIISIDSYKPEVVDEALKAGAHIANDISGGRHPDMFEVCARHGVPLIIMHMQGEPLSMQKNPTYKDAESEIFNYLLEQANAAIKAGVPSLMLDPGIGFGKRLEDNFALLCSLNWLANYEYPVLLGASRKRTIEMIEGIKTNAVDRDAGSIALHLYGRDQNVSMVRVHNVREHAQALRVWQAIRKYERVNDLSERNHLIIR